MTIKKDLNGHWRIRDIFYTFSLYFLVLMALLFLEATIFGRSILSDSSKSPWLLFCEDTVSAIVLILLPLYVVNNLYKAAIDEIGITKHNFKKNLLIGFICGFILWGIISVVDIGVESIWGKGLAHPYISALKMSDSPISYFVILFTIIILGPISEEIYFRGFIYTVFRKNYGRIIAVILTSLLFSAVHFNPLEALQIFVGSIGLTLLYEYSKSLVPVVIAHAIINLCSVYIGNS